MQVGKAAAALLTNQPILCSLLKLNLVVAGLKAEINREKEISKNLEKNERGLVIVCDEIIFKIHSNP